VINKGCGVAGWGWQDNGYGVGPEQQAVTTRDDRSAALSRPIDLDGTT